jgi:hypothetical protein
MTDSKLFDKRVLAVLKDIAKRNNPTIADGFIVESLLASVGVTTRVSSGKIYIYDGLESGIDFIEFVKQYREQIKKRK